MLSLGWLKKYKIYTKDYTKETKQNTKEKKLSTEENLKRLSYKGKN